MNGELPDGWAFARVSEVTLRVANTDPSDEPEDEFQYVDISSIDNEQFLISGTKRLKGKDAPSRARRPIRPDDVLFSNVRTYLKNIALVPDSLRKGICSTGFTVLRPNLAVDPRYLFRYVLSSEFVDRVTPHQTGTHYPATSDQAVLAEQIAIAPFAEQQRISDKLDALFEHLAACRRQLKGVSAVLGRLRQSILGAAYAGRLTADWRVAHPDVETGRQLLARIETLRLEAATSTREQNQIAEAFKETRLQNEFTEAEFENIPESWEGTRIGAIGTVVNGSTPSRNQPKFWGGTIAWVSSGEVRNNVIGETRERISKAGYESCSVRLLPPGTVLLAMIGEGKTRGQAAILEIKATINQNVAAVLIPHGLVESRFLWWWFQFQYQATRERGSGSGPQALNCQRVREIPFVLPPLAEQVEIVRRVDELLSTAGRIEQRFELASAKADKIMPSLLARAFRGELVPTEADLAAAEGRAYETAAALLERIRRGQPGSPSRSR